MGECVISLVLSHHNKIWSDGPALQPWDRPCRSSLGQINVTALCYSSVLFRKYRKIYSWGVRACQPKRCEEKKERERKRARHLALWLLLLCVSSSPWACPVWLGLARSAVCSPCGPHSGPRTFLGSIFVGFSFLFLLATAFLDSFFLF